jgi:hypothetical protein
MFEKIYTYESEKQNLIAGIMCSWWNLRNKANAGEMT